MTSHSSGRGSQLSNERIEDLTYDACRAPAVKIHEMCCDGNLLLDDDVHRWRAVANAGYLYVKYLMLT